MDRAHDYLVFAPVGRCVECFGAGQHPCPEGKRRSDGMDEPLHLRGGERMESVRTTWQVSPLWYGLGPCPCPPTSAERASPHPFEEPPALQGDERKQARRYRYANESFPPGERSGMGKAVCER